MAHGPPVIHKKISGDPPLSSRLKRLQLIALNAYELMLFFIYAQINIDLYGKTFVLFSF
jgi:hypothetical protein